MTKHLRATTVFAAIAVLAAPSAEGAERAKAKTQAATVSANGCAHKTARAAAPSEALARLGAWERIAKSTANWPLQSDTFRNERYRCRTSGRNWICLATIDVCK